MTTKTRALPKRSRWRFLEGLYELRTEPLVTSTRQAEVLNLAIASKPTPFDRVKLGRDAVTGESLGFDQWADYDDEGDDNSNINVAVLGDLGRGKSALLKILFVLRALLFGRFVVVIDKKLQGRFGEYTAIAWLCGTRPVRFVPGGGGSCLNLIDPRLGMGGPERPAGVMQLLRAVLAVAMGRPVTEREGKALRVALTRCRSNARLHGRDAVVSDLIWSLHHPDAADAEATARGLTVEELAQWGESPALALERFVEDDLAGLVDGPTSPEVARPHPSRLTVFDISQLPTHGATLPVMMLLIQTWIANLAADRAGKGLETVEIIEEGWHVTDHPEIAELFRGNLKLSRGLRLSTVTGFHHPSDFPAGSAARAMVQEAGTIFVFGQDRDTDVNDTLAITGLDESWRPILRNLAVGECLIVRPRKDPLWVYITRSDLERVLTNTARREGQADPVELPPVVAELLGEPDDWNREAAA